MKNRILQIALAFTLTMTVMEAAYKKGEYATIRLLVSRTFHAPFVVEYNNRGEGYPEQYRYYIKTKVYSGRGGYDWGGIEREESVYLKKNEVQEMLDLFSKIDFPRIYKDYPNSGIDGSNWSIFAARSGSRFEYSFHSPIGKENTKEFVAFAKHLIKLSGIKLEESDLY